MTMTHQKAQRFHSLLQWVYNYKSRPFAYKKNVLCRIYNTMREDIASTFQDLY